MSNNKGRYTALDLAGKIDDDDEVDSFVDSPTSSRTGAQGDPSDQQHEGFEISPDTSTPTRDDPDAYSRPVRILAVAAFAAVVVLALWMVPAQNADSATNAAATRRSFVCITGQLGRLELENKVATVLSPLRQAGYEPDIALVLDDADSFTTNTRGVEFQYIPPFDSVGAAADHLRGLDFTVISDESYNQVAEPILNENYVNQLDHHGHGLTIERSKNNIRMLETWAQCYREMMRDLKRASSYDIIARVREDVGFLEVIDVDNVVEDLATDPRTVISNGCRLEYGMNDKFAFVSKGAARPYFVSPFHDYYTKPLDKHVKSSESFIYYTYKAEGLNVLHSPTIRHVVKLLSDKDRRAYLFPKEPAQLAKHCNIEVTEVDALNACTSIWHADEHRLETRNNVCWPYENLPGDPSR